jgi:uncharacterized protein with PhoU and TrkA domain
MDTYSELDTEVKDIASGFGDKLNECKKQINVVNIGAFCHLVADSASDVATISNSVVSMDVDPLTVTGQVAKCGDVL